MKINTLFLVLILLMLHAGLKAQPKHSLTFRYHQYNYVTPQRTDPDLQQYLEDFDGSGVEIAYGYRFFRGAGVVVPLKVGVARVFTKDSDPRTREEDRFVNLDLLLQQEIFRYGALVNPFLQAGIGGAWRTRAEAFDVDLPLGAGLNIRLGENYYLSGVGQYRLSLGERSGIHLGVGFTANLGPARADRDGDGVSDASDACPDEVGPAALRGCPDRDNDGIADRDDACPDQAGEKALKGCPDRDGDGLADANDRCPDEAGPAANGGCPERADRDGDGLADAEDRCPDTPGPASNQGCPEIQADDRATLEKAVRIVQFESGSNKLTPESLPMLDELAGVMKKYPDYRLDIDGYTDDRGDDKFNLDLSQRRADACRNYLIGKGIPAERLRATGHGEANPVADNDSAEGRARNRRVVFALRL